MKQRLPLTAALCALGLLLMTCAGGCGSGDSGATPRRTAYPRIEPYPAAYREASADLPIVMLLNDSARVAVSDHGDVATWVDVAYPRYGGATLRITVSSLSGAGLLRAIANRRERMALNAGGLRTVATTLVAPGGLASEILTTPSAPVTPLQIIATDSTALLVTGALELPQADDPEYYAPIVAAVERDLVHMAKHLRAR